MKKVGVDIKSITTWDLMVYNVKEFFAKAILAFLAGIIIIAMCAVGAYTMFLYF